MLTQSPESQVTLAIAHAIVHDIPFTSIRDSHGAITITWASEILKREVARRGYIDFLEGLEQIQTDGRSSWGWADKRVRSAYYVFMAAGRAMFAPA